MRCKTVQELVTQEQLALTALSGAKATRLAAHLAECPDCRTWAAAVSGVRTGLGELAVEPVPPGLVPEILAAVNTPGDDHRLAARTPPAAAREEAGRRRLRRLTVRLVVGMAMVLLGIVLFRQPPEEPVRESEISRAAESGLWLMTYPVDDAGRDMAGAKPVTAAPQTLTIESARYQLSVSWVGP